MDTHQTHVALAVKGGKVMVGTCSHRGAGVLGQRYGWLRRLPSRHAEHDVLEQVHKHQLPCHRVTLWSLAYKANVWRNAKPCRSCARLMHAMGIRHCVYSCDTGTLVKQTVQQLLHEAIDSRGVRIPQLQHNAMVLQRPLKRPRFALYLRTAATFHQMYTRQKTVEGRLWSGEMRKRKKDEVIDIVYQDTKRFPVQITAVRRFRSFTKMLQTHHYTDVMPHATSPSEVIRTYHSIYAPDKRRATDVVALRVRVLDVPL